MGACTYTSGYKVCVEGLSRSTCAFYVRKGAGELVDAIGRTWGTPKSYVLGGYEM